MIGLEQRTSGKYVEKMGLVQAKAGGANRK